MSSVRPLVWAGACVSVVALALTHSTACGSILSDEMVDLVSPAPDIGGDAPGARDLSWDDPYDQTYWSRPHNTYSPDHHADLVDPLRIGIRAIELDVHELEDVAGIRQFPVKHGARDPDTWNNCRKGRGGYLRDCLNDVRDFSDAHPRHLPITLQIDLKREWITGWGDDQLDELHRQIAEVLGARLYRPEDLRAWTGHDSLRVGVAMSGWPSLRELAGRVIVLIMGGPFGDKNDTQERYVRRHRASANFFVCPNAGSPADFAHDGHADDFDEPETNAWVICGNVGSPRYWKDIASAAADNHQLMNLWGDGEYDAFHKMYLAIGWGASMISRGNADTFGGKLPLNGRRRSVPAKKNRRRHEGAAISGHRRDMMQIGFRPFGLGSLFLLVSLATGCTSRALVGMEDTPVDEGVCHGDCPAAVYAKGLRAGSSEVCDLAVTDDGGAVIAGRFMGALTIGGTTLPATPFDAVNSYIVKLDATGSVAWARHLLGNLDSCALAVRPTGEIWIAGAVEKAIDLGFGTLTADGDWPLFIAELLPDGAVGNAHMYPGSAVVSDLALAPDGDLVITGWVYAPTTLGTVVVAPKGSWQENRPRNLITRIDSAGTVAWANGYDVSVGAVTALPDGGFAIVGTYDGAATLGGLTLPAEGAPSKAFLAAFGASGAPVWASLLDPTPSIAGDSTAASAAEVVVTPEGKLGVLLVSGGQDAPVQDWKIHFQTYEPNGTWLGHVDLGNGDLRGLAFAIAPDGDLVVSGNFTEALKLGDASLEAPLDTDMYLARFTPDGAGLRWARSFGAPLSKQNLTQLGVAPTGRLVVAGTYMGSVAIDDEELPASLDNGNVFVASFDP